MTTDVKVLGVFLCVVMFLLTSHSCQAIAQYGGAGISYPSVQPQMPQPSYFATVPPGPTWQPQQYQPPPTPYPAGSQQTPWTQFYNETHGRNADGSQR